MSNLNYIQSLLQARDGSTGGIDWAGVYDISIDEAERIAGLSGDDVEFEEIWESETWWRDCNQAEDEA